MTTLAIVLAIFAHFNQTPRRNPEVPRVAEAIAATDATPEEAALLAVYVELESGVSERPRAFSWDAKAGVSCGILQEPCDYVRTHTLTEQCQWWLTALRKRGLASLDSSPSRAAKRSEMARGLLGALR